MNRCFCTMLLLLLTSLVCLPASAQIYQDDFNDNAINHTLWEYVTTGSGPVATETNQMLAVSVPADSSGFVEFSAAYKSKFLLEGDFDVQVDYHLFTWGVRNGIRIGLVLENELATTMRASHNSDNPAESYTTVVGSAYARIATNEQSGRLRLARVDGVITGSYLDAATQQWIPILVRGNYYQASPIYLKVWSSDPNFGHQKVQVAFDNFLATPYRSISGRITLQGGVNQAQPITFEFRPTDGSPTFTKTLTLNPDRTYALTGIPPGSYDVRIKGAKWLAKVLSVDGSSGNVAGVNTTLPAGDANNDNIVDVQDLAELIAAFDAEPSSPNWREGRADFNTDDIVDQLDLAVLILNFDAEGDI